MEHKMVYAPIQRKYEAQASMMAIKSGTRLGFTLIGGLKTGIGQFL